MGKRRIITIALTLSCMALLCSSWATAEKATLPKEGLLGFRLDPIMVSGNTNLHYTDSYGRARTRDRSYSASGAEFELRFWVFSVEGEVEFGKADALTLDGKAYALDSRARYEREAGLGKLNIQVAPNMKIVPFYGYQITRIDYPLSSSRTAEFESFQWEGYPVGAQIKYQVAQALQITGEYRIDLKNKGTLSYSTRRYAPDEGTASDISLRADLDLGKVGRMYGIYTMTSVNNDLGEESGNRISIGLSL